MLGIGWCEAKAHTFGVGWRGMSTGALTCPWGMGSFPRPRRPCFFACVGNKVSFPLILSSTAHFLNDDQKFHIKYSFKGKLKVSTRPAFLVPGGKAPRAEPE